MQSRAGAANYRNLRKLLPLEALTRGNECEFIAPE